MTGVRVSLPLVMSVIRARRTALIPGHVCPCP
jgi:hypothetical protein